MSAADLGSVKAGLAAMGNAELDALIKATYKVQQIAPGLLAWLDSGCVWQLQRRNGYHYELQPPEAAIPPEEDASTEKSEAISSIHLCLTFCLSSGNASGYASSLQGSVSEQRPYTKDIAFASF